VKRLLRRCSPVRRHSRRPFELVRRMRRKPPVLTLAMTRFMARGIFGRERTRSDGRSPPTLPPCSAGPHGRTAGLFIAQTCTRAW
jgi:hypothetical protein